MNKIMLLIGYLLSMYLAQAQNPHFYWADHMKGPSNSDRGASIVVDSLKNSYITGNFQGAMDFDPGAGSSVITATVLSAFVQKLDSSGNLVWVRTLPGCTGLQILLDKNYNLLIRGTLSGTVDFDPGPSVFNLAFYNGFTFIWKLDRSGNFISAQNAPDAVGTMTIDNGNNIYLAGRFSQTTDFDPGPGTYTLTPTNYADLFLLKLTPAGNFISVLKFGSGNQNVKNIKVDLNGNIYMAGLFSVTADFDPGAGVVTLAATSGAQPFLMKLNPGAGLIWANTISVPSSSTSVSCESMDIDERGNLYLTGFFTGTIDFDPGTGVYPMNGNTSGQYICRINNDGTFGWAKQMTSTYPRMVSVKKGNVYMSFESFGYQDVDFSAGVYAIASNKYQACILNIDTLSNFKWIYSFEYMTGTVIYSFDLDKNNNVYSTGEFRDTCDFNPSINTNLLIVGNTTTDIFVTKTGPCINQPASLVNVTPAQLLNICPLKTTTLTVSSSDFVDWYATPTSTVMLSEANTFKTPALSAGSYTYYVSAQNCNSTSARIPVVVNSSTVNPVLTVSGAGPLCLGSSATLTVNGANTYTWNTGALSSGITVSPTVATTYSVTGLDLNNCSNTKTLTVLVNALPVVSASTSNSVLCSGQTATLTAGGAATYTWSTNSNSLSISVSPATNTTYTVHGTDVNGCTGVAVVTQNINMCTWIEEIKNGNLIQCMPNPAGSHVTVKSSSWLEKIELISITGQVVLSERVSESQHQLDLSQVDNGIYFITVCDVDHKISRQKLIVKH